MKCDQELKYLDSLLILIVGLLGNVQRNFKDMFASLLKMGL